jgi:hypothetical protein
MDTGLLCVILACIGSGSLIAAGLARSLNR